MNYLYNRVLTEYLLSAASLSSISFDKIFSIQIKHDKHLVSSVEIGKLKNSMIYFTDFMIHRLLKDLFLARNYILLKQRGSWTEYHNRYYILIFSCVLSCLIINFCIIKNAWLIISLFLIIDLHLEGEGGVSPGDSGVYSWRLGVIDGVRGVNSPFSLVRLEY